MPPRTPRELQSDIQRAVQILELFTDPNKGRDVKMVIPPSILKNAHGIVFIRLVRVGFLLSAKNGTGIIIARLPDGSWSAPSGISMSSFGVGHQVGGEVIDSIIVMNYRAAVKAFFDGGGQLQLGVSVSMTAGPLGRSADLSASASNANHIAATYAYSTSKGLFFGYSLEGSKISERINTNQAYYGRPISARDILTGGVPPTQDAARLYDLLNAMGAGPRPGLPFAPTKSLSPTQSFVSPPLQQQQQQQQQPQAQYHQPTEVYEEPPPPYDGPPPKSSDHDAMMNVPSSSAPPINDSKRPIQQPNAADPNMYHNNSSREVAMNDIGSSSTNPFYDHNENEYPNDMKKKPPIIEQEMTVVVAKYDFHSDEPTDLSFTAGDHIIVTKRLPDRQSWWEGEIGTKRGYFPANYTDEIADD